MKKRLVLKHWAKETIVEIIFLVLMLVGVLFISTRIEKLENQGQKLECYEIEYNKEIYKVCEK
ncbi:MAG: hypothetical protein RR478_04780 [Bacilli bacterium]